MARKNSRLSTLDWITVFDVDHLIFTWRLYNNLADLPEKPDTMIIVLRPELADNAVKQAVESGVKTIWFQPGAYSKAAEQEALKAGLRVHNACFMLAAGIW